MSNLDGRDDLSRELHSRSLDVGGTPIALDQVKRSANRIRTRRRIVAGTVAAAVLAIAVPTALSITGDGTNSVGPVGPSPSLTPSPTPAPTPQPDGTFPLTVQGLPVGDPARLPYVLADTHRLVTTDGTVDLPESYAMITPYAGGWLAVGSAQHGGQIIMLDKDLNVTRTEPAGGGDLAVSADGSHVAYTVRQGKNQVLLVDAPTDGSDPLTWTIDVPGGESLDPVGFLGDDTVVYNSDAGSVMGIAGTGGTLTPIKGFLRVDDASEASGLVSGLVSYDVEGGCSGVMDPADGTLLWKSCDVSRLRFSPDGRHVVADASYFDGPGSPTLSVRDATSGAEVLTFAAKSRDTVVGVTQAAWEDDQTLLAYVEEGVDQALLRLRLDGSTERVTDVFTVNALEVKAWFAEEPR